MLNREKVITQQMPAGISARKLSTILVLNPRMIAEDMKSRQDTRMMVSSTIIWRTRPLMKAPRIAPMPKVPSRPP